jgi:uncharacterized protein YceH (UPF0502 family)
MEIHLNATEVRVLGSLLEKEMATPDYYPLSLNGLVNACNQKSNREPVVDYDETTVVRALDSLNEKGLVRQSNVSRVPKYEQNFTGPNKLVNREAAIICIILLRGPQTIGEIRGRTERLYRFAGLDETEETINALIDLGYVMKLPRQPGHKEFRFAHLLTGDPVLSAGAPVSRPEAATLEVRAVDERIAALAEELQELRREVQELQQAFADFRGQFD